MHRTLPTLPTRSKTKNPHPMENARRQEAREKKVGSLEELRHVVLVGTHTVTVLAAERLSEHGVHLASSLIQNMKHKARTSGWL